MRLIDADALKAAMSAQDYDAWSDRADLFVACSAIDEAPTIGLEVARKSRDTHRIIEALEQKYDGSVRLINAYISQDDIRRMMDNEILDK